MKPFIDISGKRFGKLVAVKMVGRERNLNGKSLVLWECKCDCGNTHIASRTDLYKIKSCGCSHVEQVKRLGYKKRKPVGYSARNKLMKKYEAQAKYRGLAWKLSQAEFNELTKQNCYYCDKEPSQVVSLKGCNGEYVYNGVDRLDNNRGYTPDNCVPCCGVCNKAKMTMTEDEFADWVHRVYFKFAAYRKFRRGVYVEIQRDGTADWWHKELEEQGISK